MEDDENLREAEERLYAQAYHDNSIEIEIPTTSFSDSPTINSNKPKVRYWQNSKPNTSTPKQQNQKFQPHKKRNFQKFQKDQKPNDENVNEAKVSEPVEVAKKFFVPYSSVLSSFVMPPEMSNEIVETKNGASNFEKKNKTMKIPKEKKIDRVAQKQLTKSIYAAKVMKAEKARRKQTKKNPIESIAIDTSSEDEVILVTLKPPPIINLDSSEDEGRIKKKKRAASPSSSSMISDDFIVSGDRTRLSHPLSSFEQQSNDVNDRLMEVLNEREKIKKIKNLTKVSSSSSNSARSSCERSVKEKVKSKKKVQLETSEVTETVYTKAKSKKKKSQSESSDDDGVVQKALSKKKRRKSSGSRKKSTDEKPSDDDEEAKDKDPKLELISNTLKAQKKKKSSHNDERVVEQPKEIIESVEVVEEAVESQEEEVEIILQPPEPIYEITDDEDADVNVDSDDSMKNFNPNVECDLSLNVTTSTSIPHALDFIPEDFQRSFSTELDCEVGWNDEMKFFYNECSYGRDFSLSAIQQAMPYHPKHWQVNHADCVRMYTDNDRKIRCRNCNELGHIAVRCNRPKKRIVCYMCGENNHRETRCPNAICLRCGKPNRVFSTMCSNCHKTSLQTCAICKFRGHLMEHCPDKWRRFHSTTSPDHEDQLDVSFKVNSRVYCSICTKKGHFAENCTQFMKAISGLITSSHIKIVSSKSPYVKGSDVTKTNSQVLQLVTYLDSYKFNFNLPENCQLYPKFREMFKKHQYEMFVKLQAINDTPKRKRKRAKSKKNSSTVIEELKDNSVVQSEHVAFDDSNSNYSFSEFYIANHPTTTNNGNQIGAASDFIPLQNATIINRIPSPIDKISDAKIMLTKEHATYLMSSKGQNFVYDLGVRFNITSQFNWDATGNSLIITGLARNQKNFHAQIRGSIYKFEIEEYTSKILKSIQPPRVRAQLVSYLQNNLKLIKQVSIKETRKNLLNLIAAEREMDHKKTIKFRKILNIIFMGFTGLKEGASRVGELRKILLEQKREVEKNNVDLLIDQQLRDEISNHILYIFTAIDHGNYRQMFEDFRKIIHDRSGQKFVINPVLR